MLNTESETQILQRLVGLEANSLSPEVAEQLLKVGFSETDQLRIDELSARAQGNSLNSVEQEQLDGYINVGHFIAFVRSKARKAIKDHASRTSAA
jgi:hypothetical protein